MRLKREEKRARVRDERILRIKKIVALRQKKKDIRRLKLQRGAARKNSEKNRIRIEREALRKSRIQKEIQARRSRKLIKQRIAVKRLVDKRRRKRENKKTEERKRRGRRDEKDEEEKGIEIGGVERRREFRERVGSGQRSYGRKGQPLILRSESITMDCFWHPQDSGGC